MVETTTNTNDPNFKEQLDNTQIVQDIESGQAGTSVGGAPAPTMSSTSTAAAAAAAARDNDNDVIINGPNFKHQCQDVTPPPQQMDKNDNNTTTTSHNNNLTTSNNGEEPPIAMALPVVVEAVDEKKNSSSSDEYTLSIAKETVIKWLLLIIVLFILVGAVVGGVCGAGLCSSSDSGKSKNNNDDNKNDNNKNDGNKNNNRSSKNKNDNNNNQGPPPTPATTPTRGPTFPPVTEAPTAAPVTAAPTQAPTMDDGKCQSDDNCNTDSSSSLNSICLDETCCTEECRRVLLTSVFTDDDGAGGNVEPQFYINDQQVYPINGGIGNLAPQTRIYFSEPNLPQLGNIRPTNVNLDFRAFEKDGGTFVDPDDNDFVTIPNSQWYVPQERTPYDLSTTLGGWVFHYTIQTECCSTN